MNQIISGKFPTQIDVKKARYCQELVVANAWIALLVAIVFLSIGLLIPALLLLLFGVAIITCVFAGILPVLRPLNYLYLEIHVVRYEK